MHGRKTLMRRAQLAGAAEAAYDFDQALGESPVTRLNVFER